MAFRLLASSSPSGSDEKTDAVSAFLSQHILGFMARFGEVVNDIQNQYALIDKIRCIKGVEEMVKIGKKVIRVARPQVSSQLFHHLHEWLMVALKGLCIFTTSFGATRATICCFLCLGQTPSQP